MAGESQVVAGSETVQGLGERCHCVKLARERPENLSEPIDLLYRILRPSPR